MNRFASSVPRLLRTKTSTSTSILSALRRTIPKASSSYLLSTLSSSPSSYSHYNHNARIFSTTTLSEKHNETKNFSTTGKKKKGEFDKIAFIGAGKMAEAMISPLITSSVQPPSAISIYDVSTTVTKRIVSLYPNITTAQSIPDCISNADLIVIAVKPHNLSKVYGEIRRATNDDATVVRDDATLLSIVAGKSISNFVNGSGISRVARSMPNTPAQIGKGVTVWSCTENVTVEEREKIKSVLDTFGKSIYVDDESYIDMSTSISGSGPAYIFLLMEAMIDAGVHMGFSRDTATTLVYQTLLGSTLYAIETGEHPAILRNSVTSPAGTTASAIYELENGRFRTVIKDAIWACYRRSLEMGGMDSNIGPGRVATPHPAAAPDVVPPPPESPIASVKASSTSAATIASSKEGHHPVEPPSDEMNDENGK